MSGELKIKFRDKSYRDAYVAEQIRTVLASQIEALRTKEGYTQAELARKLGTTQNVISRLEDPDYGKFTLQTLLELASAFEVALLVKFATFSRFIAEYSDVSREALAVPSIAEENWNTEVHSAETNNLDNDSTIPAVGDVASNYEDVQPQAA
jgi:transcriptional regulator with XRE-family HTH domain